MFFFWFVYGGGIVLYFRICCWLVLYWLYLRFFLFILGLLSCDLVEFGEKNKEFINDFGIDFFKVEVFFFVYGIIFMLGNFVYLRGCCFLVVYLICCLFYCWVF